jgi:hypothetical protein
MPMRRNDAVELRDPNAARHLIPRLFSYPKGGNLRRQYLPVVHEIALMTARGGVGKDKATAADVDLAWWFQVEWLGQSVPYHFISVVRPANM